MKSALDADALREIDRLFTGSGGADSSAKPLCSIMVRDSADLSKLSDGEVVKDARTKTIAYKQQTRLVVELKENVIVFQPHRI